jgi:hypothetical protein
MTTQSIDFHERCLKNRIDGLRRQRAELERLQASVERSSRLAEFLAEQIKQAKAQRKTRFDADRFMAKFNPVNNEVK